MRKQLWAQGRLSSRDALVLVSSGILIGTTLILWASDFAYANEVTKEDGIVENLTALFFLLSSAYCSYQLICKPRTQYRAFLVLWALLSFVFLGEETSWFQRLANIPTPESVQAVNEQDELNIHNLTWFVGEYGMVEALEKGDNILGAVFNSDNLFRMGYVTYFFIIPMLVYSKRFNWIESSLHYPTPSTIFFASVWTTLLVAFILFVLSPRELRVDVLAEVREMTFAAFIMLYSMTHLGRGIPTPQAGA